MPVFRRVRVEYSVDIVTHPIEDFDRVWKEGCLEDITLEPRAVKECV